MAEPFEVEPFVVLSNARTEEQRLVMEGIKERGECPFDPDTLATTHRQPILQQGEHWTLTYNQWPYKHTRLHLLAIAAYHAESLSDLHDGAFDELQRQFTWAEDVFKIASGGLAMRFGDPRGNGGTVNHLHAHLIVPVENVPQDEKVRFKIS